MANADVTQITLRTLSLLICVALIAISVYLVAGVERKDTRWMVSCPPAVAVLSWHLIELVVAKCRRGQPFHPAVTLAVHLVIWGACLTCLIWLAFWIDSYGPYSGTWASYLQVRPKLKVFGSVLTALIGCLLALHFIFFVRSSTKLYRHNHPPRPQAAVFIPPSASIEPSAAAQDQSTLLKGGHTRWRKPVLGFAFAAFIAFALNLSFLAWALARSGADIYGVGTLTTGSCSSMKKLNVGIHVVINALSTVLLTGSNYCMQCLSAPDRHLVNRKHAEGRWLDIGLPSFRNVIFSSGRKRRLWWLLCLSSLPLHLLYNSAVFPAISASAYSATSVNEAYVANMTLSDRAGFVALSPTECIAAYTVPFQSTHGGVLVVSEGDLRNQMTAYQTDLQFYAVNIAGPCDKRVSHEWMCRQLCVENCAHCDTFLEGVAREDITEWQPFGFPVKYCLSQPVEETCSLKFSIPIWWAVVAFNLFKIFLMWLVAQHDQSYQPLLTVGDAIASFLREPDNSPAQTPFLSKRDITRRGGDHIGSETPRFKDVVPRKLSAVSRSRWAICTFIYLFALAIWIFLLCYGLTNSRGVAPSALFSLGLGSVRAQTLLTTDISGRGPGSLVGNVIVANTPQVIVSLLYFIYNGLFTAMALATEWSSFAIKSKGLRVSSAPHGQQRSTYWLQLPFRYSLPLVALSGVVHWLISQSLFMVFVEADGSAKEEMLRALDFVTLGWSPIAMASVLGVVSIMLIALVAVAFWPLKSAMPIAAGCSMAIASACHSPGAGDAALAECERELRWGAVRGHDGTWRYCFTSDPEVFVPGGRA